MLFKPFGVDWDKKKFSLFWAKIDSGFFLAKFSVIQTYSHIWPAGRAGSKQTLGN